MKFTRPRLGFNVGLLTSQVARVSGRAASGQKSVRTSGRGRPKLALAQYSTLSIGPLSWFRPLRALGYQHRPALMSYWSSGIHALRPQLIGDSWGYLGGRGAVRSTTLLQPKMGTLVSNINHLMARASGAFARALRLVLQKKWRLVLTPSGLVCLRHAGLSLWATPNHQQPRLRGARNLYSRSKSPTVRGVARNPNDHPHGGRTKAIRCPRTPWSRVAHNRPFPLKRRFK